MKYLVIFIIIIVIISIIIIFYVTQVIKTINTGESFHYKKHPELYNTLTFDESKFEPPNDLKEDYWSIVGRGYQDMKNIRIIFSGITRDNENIIGLNIQKMKLIGSYFEDYRIVIFENDSKDRTREIIEQYSEEDYKINLVPCS